ncbi:MAG: hypothetical protein RLZZ117_1118 [Cyanobacteriota bacterium]|jgi:hypothetical protein
MSPRPSPLPRDACIAVAWPPWKRCWIVPTPPLERKEKLAPGCFLCCSGRNTHLQPCLLASQAVTIQRHPFHQLPTVPPLRHHQAPCPFNPSRRRRNPLLRIWTSLPSTRKGPRHSPVRPPLRRLRLRPPSPLRCPWPPLRTPPGHRLPSQRPWTRRLARSKSPFPRYQPPNPGGVLLRWTLSQPPPLCATPFHCKSLAKGDRLTSRSRPRIASNLSPVPRPCPAPASLWRRRTPQNNVSRQTRRPFRLLRTPPTLRFRLFPSLLRQSIEPLPLRVCRLATRSRTFHRRQIHPLLCQPTVG